MYIIPEKFATFDCQNVQEAQQSSTVVGYVVALSCNPIALWIGGLLWEPTNRHKYTLRDGL
jgi:hypothetical protein